MTAAHLEAAHLAPSTRATAGLDAKLRARRAIRHAHALRQYLGHEPAGPELDEAIRGYNRGGGPAEWQATFPQWLRHLAQTGTAP